jgi:hypothetical protein
VSVLLQDLRHALRTFRDSSGFAAVVVITIAETSDRSRRLRERCQRSDRCLRLDRLPASRARWNGEWRIVNVLWELRSQAAR